MQQDVIATVAQTMGFTPLEIVLMLAVVTMFVMMIKSSKEQTTAIVNNTNALNGLMSMIKARKGKT